MANGTIPSGLGHRKQFDTFIYLQSLTHTYDGDLELLLTSPEATTVQLFANVGGGANNFTNTVLDDEAGTSIAAGTAPFTGSFRPTGLLSGFDGELATGTWTLTIIDHHGGDSGTLNSWGIRLAAAPSSALVKWVDFDFIGLENGSQSNPFDTLQEAKNAVTTGGTVKIYAGSSAELPTLDKAMTLEAVGGIATIGAP